MAKFLKNYFWAFLWSLLILTVCLIPSDGLPKINFLSGYHLDKFIHLFLFFVQCSLFLIRANKIKNNFAIKRHILFTLIYSLLLGTSVEFIQHYYVFGRAGDFNDVLADFIGILLGISFFLLKKSNLIEPN